MKSYDISVDSDTYASGAITDRVYYLDASKFPRGTYSLEWTFQSSVVTGLATLLATGPICVHMDQWTGPYQYQSTASSMPTHSVLGFLNPNFVSTTDGIMTCDMKTNGTVILDVLPSTNFFTVKLRYGFSTTAPASFGRYVMTLELTPLKGVQPPYD